MSVVAEIPGLIQILSDDTVRCITPEISPTSPLVFTNGYKSKDITINPIKPITARLFLPQITSTPNPRLPVVFYFHGGGFCIGSTTWLGFHHFLANMCVMSKCLIISVDYRLAPESRIPAAYDDCFESVEWLVIKNTTSNFEGNYGDSWLACADLSWIFLCGDSAGGNIVHHVALRCMSSPNKDIKIKGLILIHPYFGSEARTENERNAPDPEVVKTSDELWRLSLPVGANRDHFACNFESSLDDDDDDDDELWKDFPQVVVHVAGRDLLKERGVMYAEFLKKKKGVKEVVVVEEENESHVYHFLNPDCEATLALHRKFSEFISRV